MALAAIALTVSFTSCNNDDDDNDNGEDSSSGACKTCEFQSISTEYCDNGDGTITITALGISQTQNLEGVAFDQFVLGLESSGTCN